MTCLSLPKRRLSMAMHRFDWLFYCCTSAKPKPPFLFMTQSTPKRFLICSEADTQLTQASSSVVVVVRLKVDLKSFSLSTRRPALEMEISRSKSLTFPPSTTATFCPADFPDHRANKLSCLFEYRQYTNVDTLNHNSTLTIFPQIGLSKYTIN